ncbi:hypothetical protein [Amycolatopsis sp. NPDC004079]|uniref:hypothetical protein n=1 Tax=Amycolatopsis sp. NPDC004079 TaxID=3154549 RepID=UPI0033B02D57
MNDRTRAPEAFAATAAADRAFDRLAAWAMLLVGAVLAAVTASGWLISSAAARIVLALLFCVLVAAGAYMLGKLRRG